MQPIPHQIPNLKFMTMGIFVIRFDCGLTELALQMTTWSTLDITRQVLQSHTYNNLQTLFSLIKTGDEMVQQYIFHYWTDDKAQFASNKKTLMLNNRIQV